VAVTGESGARTAPDEVPATTVAAVAATVATARSLLASTVARREEAVRALTATNDPDDALVARVFTDFLLQADEVRRSGAALAVATGPDGAPVVGRMAVLDEDHDAVLVPWHAPVGQAQLVAPDRLMVTEHPDGSVTLHALAADEVALAGRIRAQMRAAAVVDRMSDPLATLTAEQGRVLAAIAGADGDVVLTGPPGSGKSAIVMVELARRLLSSATPSSFRVVFVTGTDRLARRAEALTRLLGTASVTPVPQDVALQFLGIVATPTPPASDSDGSLLLPRAITTTFEEVRGRLATDREIPHPLGHVPADEVDAVHVVRARAATQSYRASARELAAALEAEYQRIIPGERSAAAARAAAEELRPHVTPSALLATALARTPALGRLSRPIRAAGVALADELLAEAPHAARPTWDLVVVDEYQRLPDVVLALLRRRARTVLLSGDPLQSFAGADVGHHLRRVSTVALATSLRMPAAVGEWIDDEWTARGWQPPGVRCAATGGSVDHAAALPDDPADDPTTQVIAPGSRAARRDGWLGPAEAVGLEWPRVVLVDPDRIVAEHGPAGLFIAATRAIDRLLVVA
jgi:hypothetical protein